MRRLSSESTPSASRQRPGLGDAFRQVSCALRKGSVLAAVALVKGASAARARRPRRSCSAWSQKASGPLRRHRAPPTGSRGSRGAARQTCTRPSEKLGVVTAITPRGRAASTVPAGGSTGGGSGARQSPNVFSMRRRTASGATSPTTTSTVRSGRYQRSWKLRRASAVSPFTDGSVPPGDRRAATSPGMTNCWMPSPSAVDPVRRTAISCRMTPRSRSTAAGSKVSPSMASRIHAKVRSSLASFTCGMSNT